MIKIKFYFTSGNTKIIEMGYETLIEFIDNTIGKADIPDNKKPYYAGSDKQIVMWERVEYFELVEGDVDGKNI